MSTSNASLRSWVEEVARLTKPDSIHWCTGSDAENSKLIEVMLGNGDLIKLNQTTHPNCYLHRSHPSDVARVEHLTFVCTRNKEDAGPNNHWMDPKEAHRKIDALFEGAMRGRTMYVIPYCMGPIDSPYSRCGVEITDSAYVVAQHAHHDAHGRGGPQAHRARRHLRTRPAFHRRSRPRAPLHHALPRGIVDQERRLRLRRKRPSGQEMPCPAHRQLAGAR